VLKNDVTMSESGHKEHKDVEFCTQVIDDVIKIRVCKYVTRLKCEDEEECINNEVVPEIHFVALLKLKSPVCTNSVESTLALNPWCCGAKVVYVHTPGAHPPTTKPSVIH
jgi:hypothetical protein